MQKKGYEDVFAILCDYWWVLLTLVIVALALYFTRMYWLPLLGLA